MICRGEDKSNPATSNRFVTSEEMLGLVKGLSRVCAANLRHADAPISQELFRRVEIDGQSLIEATRLLDLGPKDGAYLLAGLRRDIAIELVVLLLDAQTPCQSFTDENIDSKSPD